MRKYILALGLLLVFSHSVSVSKAADLWGLKAGNPGLKSANSLTFGPTNILLIGDPKSAAIVAIDTGEAKADASNRFEVEGLEKKLAKLLGTSEIKINDLAVNPNSGSVFLSITLGQKDDSEPAIVKVTSAGKLESVSLSKVRFAKVVLPDAPKDAIVKRGRRSSNPRLDSITDLAYLNGKVIVSGLAAGSSASSVREIAFPFITADKGTPVEIFHGAHGRFEDYSAIRTFVPFNINGEPTLLAGYVCTPLVKFPLKNIKGAKTRGTTVAELGNRNRPLDMIVYTKGDEDFILMANDRRGVMKISTADIATNQGITKRVGGNGLAGQTYETIDAWKGVVQLDRQTGTTAAIIIDNQGALSLKTVELP